MSNICVDTGFLLALYARRDQRDRQNRAREYLAKFDNRTNKLVLAWPVMFESLRRELVEYRPGLERFEVDFVRLRRNDQLILVDDKPYRERALEQCFSELRLGPRFRPVSLVDRVLRALLMDLAHRISGLISFDVRDFQDVCRNQGIELYA